MMMRLPLIICLFIASAYGCAIILMQDYPLYTKSDWQYEVFIFVPWVFLFFAVKGWHKCYIWRRMLHARQSAPTLSRGDHFVTKPQARPSILERICLCSMLFAIAAILKTLFIQNISWWIGGIIASCLLFRMVAMTVRKP